MNYRYTYHPYYGPMPLSPQFTQGMRPPYINYSNPSDVNQHAEDINQHIENETEKDLTPDRKSTHTHGHLGATTCADGHVHMHPGVTSMPIETKKGHVHKMSGDTTFDDGHIHSYEAYTGPPIPLPNGYHTHYVEIKTTENDRHIHIIRGFTQPSKS